MTSNGTSRRNLLTRGLVGAAAAIGLGAGAGVTAARTGGGDRETAQRRTIRLDGRKWTLTTAGRRLGEQVQPGDRGTVHGELLDRKGRVVGSFLGSHAAAPAQPGGLVADASLELHTFTLEDGTLLGMGSSIKGVSVFSIVGGTGRYQGARGSYTARQGIPELGGDGTASFEIDLTA